MTTKPTPPTRIIPMEKLTYEKMITLKQHVVDVKESAEGDLMVSIIPLSNNVMGSTLKHHVVDVKESTQGVLTVAIIPLSDDVMDSTVISHDPADTVVRVSTSRDMRTDARSVTAMAGV